MDSFILQDHIHKYKFSFTQTLIYSKYSAFYLLLIQTFVPDYCEARIRLYYIKWFVNKIVFSYEFKCPESYATFDTIWQFMDNLNSCLEEQTFINYRPVSPSLIVIFTSSFIRLYVTITSYFEVKKRNFSNMYTGN